MLLRYFLKIIFLKGSVEAIIQPQGRGWSDDVVVEGSKLEGQWIGFRHASINIDKDEHLELLHKSRFLKTDLHRFLYRRTIGIENFVPQRPVGIVACMHLALMMQNVFLGPLNKIANPLRCPDVPVRKQGDEELEDTGDGNCTQVKP